MHRLRHRRPSPAMGVALIALFVSLSGSAYAAFTLPRNSVGTAQLQKGAVTGAKLHAGAVTAGKIKAHSLLANDFAAGQLPAGPQGPQGPAGPATGQAGGDLTGSYPNPSIAPGAVTSGKLADGSITGTKFASGAQTTLASGQTLRGMWAVSTNSGSASGIDGGVGFNLTLQSAPTPQLVTSGSAPPNCPGTSADPEAAGGYLCVYEEVGNNIGSLSVCSLGVCPGAEPWGFQLDASTAASGYGFERGSYAVTAP